MVTSHSLGGGAASNCPKCQGAGWYYYDEIHGTICDLCCKHDQGWSQLSEHYDAKAGKWCCNAGCGKLLDELPPNELAQGKSG